MKKLLLIVLVVGLMVPMWAVYAQDDALAKAELLLEDGAFEDAIAIYDDVLDEDNENIAALVGRSEAYLALGEATLALTDAKRAVSLDPESAEAYIARGFAQLSAGDIELAIEDLEVAAELDPDSGEAFFAQAELYAILGESTRALVNYDAAIEAEPENSDYLYNRGQFHYAMGDLDLALADYDAAIEIDPENPDYYFSRAFVHFDNGDFEATIADDDRVIELAPDFPSGYLNRGFHYYVNEEFEQASLDYFQWITLGETERFDLDEIEGAERLDLDMDEGWGYYIPFSAPDAATINVEVISPGGLVDPVVVILDSEGTPIMVDDDGGFGLSAELEDYTLPGEGDYTLVVSHAGGGSVGEIVVDVEIGQDFGNA